MSEYRKKPPAARHYDPYRGNEHIDRSDDDEDRGLIEGKNAVVEALRAKRALDKVYIAKGSQDPAISFIASKARESGAAVTECDRRKLDAMSITGAHQGVIAVTALKKYASINDIFDIAAERGEDPFIIVCDEITDPHNIGAIIRTAEAVGAHGIIIPKRRSAGLTQIVSKTSAGAVEHMAVAKVTNLTSAIRELKDRGLWIYGTAADGDAELWQADLRGPIAVVIGSEGSGISRLVADNCDVMLSIPMRGKVSSLNASVSAAVVMYEVLRQRN